MNLNKKIGNLLGVIIISITIGLIIGYTVAHSQHKINCERCFNDGINEMTVVWKSAICKP